jgi:pimeloyl-ACP methyl ester carboxylesterase
MKRVRIEKPTSRHEARWLEAQGSGMTTYVLIHGAGDVGWYWHLVEAELRSRGHDVVAPDLPCNDDSAGLSEYADAVVQAIGDRTDLVVVAQSLGGFTAPLVWDRVPVTLLVLVAPMIPAPGEAPADYWANTRYDEEVRESYYDPIDLFYQDVPPERMGVAYLLGLPGTIPAIAGRGRDRRCSRQIRSSSLRRGQHDGSGAWCHPRSWHHDGSAGKGGCRPGWCGSRGCPVGPAVRLPARPC